MLPIKELRQILLDAANDEKATVAGFMALLQRAHLPRNRDDREGEIPIHQEGLRVGYESYFDALSRKNRKDIIEAIFQNNIPLPDIVLHVRKQLYSDQFWRQYWYTYHSVVPTTPLMHALDSGDDDLVLLLLSKVKVEPGRRYEDYEGCAEFMSKDVFFAPGIAYDSPEKVLLKACEQGLTKSIQFMIGENSPIFYRLYQEEKIGLEWAIQHEKPDIARIFLAKSGILDSYDDKALRRNLLAMAISTSADDIIDYFTSEAYRFRKDDFELGPEEFALKTKNEALVKRLEPKNLEQEDAVTAYKRHFKYQAAKMSEAFCQPYQQRESNLWQGSTPQQKAAIFELALQYQDWDKVTECIKARAALPKNFDLFAAYHTGNLAVFEALFAARKDYRLVTNRVNKEGMTLFSAAMRDKKPEVVRCLVKHGVQKVFTVNDIRYYVGNMSLEMFQAFQFTDADLRWIFNESFSDATNTVLSILIKRLPEEAEKLERAQCAGASERMVKECKKRDPNLKIIQKLLTLGARQDWDQNQNPLTLFLAAVPVGEPMDRSVFSLLLENQPNFKPNAEGKSPLGTAYARFGVDPVKTLLDRGASIRVLNLEPRDLPQFKRYFYSLPKKSDIARHDAVLLFLEDNVKRLEGRKYTFESTRKRNSKKILELKKYIQHLKTYDPQKGIEDIFSLKLPDADLSLIQTLNAHSRPVTPGKTQSLKDFLKIFGKEITAPELKTLLKAPKTKLTPKPS